MTHSVKITEAGEMHTITLCGITSYHIFTKAGYFRGGKIYFADKIIRVLSGELKLISCSTLRLDKGDLEEVEILTPQTGEKCIPAGIPHIFQAMTDCIFIESFPENTESEEYERYRVMKK